MAYPVYTEVVVTQTASGTSHVLNIPSVGAGDLLLVMFYQNGSDGGEQYTISDSFTELEDSGGIPKCAFFAKNCAGTEGATITVTSTNPGEGMGVVKRYAAGNWHGTSLPEISAGSTGTGTVISPDGVTASWGVDDNQFLAIAVADFDNGGDDITANPAGYTAVTDGVDTSPFVYTNLGVIAVAEKNATAASDTPGTFTSAQPQQWKGLQIVVRGPAGVVPVVSDVGTDEIILEGQSDVNITGSNFGDPQGTGTVILSPTNDINDASAIELTATSWIDTNITIGTWTFAGTGVAEGGNAWVFVTDDNGGVSAGFQITREVPSVTYSFLTEPLGNNTGAGVHANTTVYCYFWPDKVPTDTPLGEPEYTTGLTDAQGRFLIESASNLKGFALIFDNPDLDLTGAFLEVGTPS